jgi:hypothetical protein
MSGTETDVPLAGGGTTILGILGTAIEGGPRCHHNRPI